MKKLILLLLFIPLVSFGQKSNGPKLKSKVWLNGKAFWAPEGFEHQGNLVWRKENDLIVVASTKGSFNAEIFQETCEKGTESASYLMNDSYQHNGIDYQICFSIGANDMLVAQINILNDNYTYTLTTGTYLFDYLDGELNESNVTDVIRQARVKLAYYYSYMITLIKNPDLS